MSTAALLKQAQDAGLTLRLVEGKVKVTGKQSSIDALIEPLRQHKTDLALWLSQAPANEPPTDPADWRELAAAYHDHHFGCKHCHAAGRGVRYGLRCGTGMALWCAYVQADQPAVGLIQHERNRA